MTFYLDRRTFIILEVEDLANQRDPSNLIRVYYIADYEAGAVEDAAPEIINVLGTNGVGSGYTLDDHRGWFERGASAAGEEIILTIETAIAGGVAGAVIKQLMGWAAKKLGRDNQEALTSIEHHLAAVKRLVESYFNPQGELEVLKVTSHGSTYTVELQDSRGNHYKAEIGKGGSIVVEKIPDSLSSEVATVPEVGEHNSASADIAEAE